MGSDLDADRISGLPKNVIEAILMCLPIRDAVRTSVLSRGWRYEWSTTPQLVIDKKSFLIYDRLLPNERNMKLVKVVDHILLLHSGPILKFTLSVDLEGSADIDRWILVLSRNGITEFTLDVWKGEVYKLPSYFFTCDLTYLELYRCTVTPPVSFRGFRSLTMLDLQCVTFTDEGLSSLLSLCPLLKNLLLRDISGCTQLKIRARELVDLTFEGVLDDIHFESTPLLSTASIKLLTVADSLSTDETGCRMVKVIGSIPSIHRLELLEHTLQNLAVGVVPLCLPELCPVKHLIIHINFEDMQEMLGAFCIFRSSPLMEKLGVRAISDKDIAGASADSFCLIEEDFSCTFSHLQSVEVTDLTGIKSEFKLIEFILANAPVLERMHIEFKENAGDLVKIFRELIRYPRASPKAELFVPE